MDIQGNKIILEIRAGAGRPWRVTFSELRQGRASPLVIY